MIDDDRWKMEEIECQRKNRNMALISDVSCMTWMTLRIITIYLDAEGSFYVDTQPLYTRSSTFAQV